MVICIKITNVYEIRSSHEDFNEMAEEIDFHGNPSSAVVFLPYLLGECRAANKKITRACAWPCRTQPNYFTSKLILIDELNLIERLIFISNYKLALMKNAESVYCSFNISKSSVWSVNFTTLSLFY